MPWKVFKNGERYCVHKHIGGKKGERVPGGCHPSREQAERHLRALYAAEGRSTKERLFGVVKSVFDNLRGKKGTDHSFMIFKDRDSGQLRFLAKYSNKFRDNDSPVQEIISDNSHRRFAEMVDKGVEPMPELWLWHVPEWKFGVADWHAYDDSGFAMASGLVDKGKEQMAIWLSKQKGVRTSHGMPLASIIRDPDDPTVIVGHVTKEISVLPSFAAANKMTGFLILGNEISKETDMAIPETKLRELAEKWNADPELLKEIERMNAAEAEAAEALGIESKEVGEAELSTEAVVEEEKAEDADADADNATGDSLTGEQIAEAVVAAVKPLLDETRKLADDVAGLRKEVTYLKEKDEAKIKEVLTATPPASLGALIAQRLSATNSPETEIDGRTSLAKSRPEEATTAKMTRTGIPFIDDMLSQNL
jgi:hypothetical protein